MNNEFEWRKQMRKLADAIEPSHDLWPGISTRVAGAYREPATVRHRHRWMAIAASLIIAGGAALTAYQLQYRQGSAPAASLAQPTAASVGIAAKTDAPRTALDWATPDDPALVHAAQDLDHASAQIGEALERHPDAVFLVGLLNRTNGQRMRLLRQDPYAG
jgi:hypothetical protein